MCELSCAYILPLVYTCRSSTNAEKLLEKDCFIALEILCINSGLPQVVYR